MRLRSEPCCENEGELVRGAQRGDQAAIAGLFRCYWGQALRWAGRLVRPTEAEDVVQTALSKVFCRICKEPIRRSFRAMLWKAVHNEAITVLRRRARRPAAQLDEESCDARVSEAGGFDPAQEEWLEGAIQRLPEQQHAVIVLVLRAYPNAEIAEILGKNPGTVAKLKHDALRGLDKMRCDWISRS